MIDIQPLFAEPLLSSGFRIVAYFTVVALKFFMLSYYMYKLKLATNLTSVVLLQIVIFFHF
jgi:hypothetical protein